MAKVKIICDSAADIPREDAERLNIRVLPLWVTFDGENYLRDGVDITNEEFFNKMRTEKIMPKTSQITADEWEKAIREEMDSYESIVVITMSSAASGTCQSANIARNEILSSEPDRDITVIDSMGLSYPYGFAVTKAAERALLGEDRDAVIKEFERVFSKAEYFFLVEDLEYLKKGGRINLATLAIANIMDIKPILTVRDGLVVSCDKIRGGKKLYDKFMQMYKDKGHILTGKDIYIIHSLTKEKLLEFTDAAENAFSPSSIKAAELGATIGSHAGPGLSAILYIKD